MRELLVDYIPFEVSKHQIQESLKENDGKLVVKGVLQRADAKNQNGRVYPKEILMREANAYNKNFVKESRAMGELDHPESSVVNLANVSHNITDMHWNSDDLVGTVEVLTTPSGNILRELFRNGIKLGISSRGVGSVETVKESTDGEEDQEVINPYSEVKVTLNPVETAIYDCTMGSYHAHLMAGEAGQQVIASKLYKDFYKGKIWFIENNPEAYFQLID